jgi:hypothetical protein
MTLLNFDRDAVDRIVDRCSPGGSDNSKGSEFDRELAEGQLDLHLAAFVPENERQLVRDYFEDAVAEDASAEQGSLA